MIDKNKLVQTTLAGLVALGSALAALTDGSLVFGRLISYKSSLYFPMQSPLCAVNSP